jgi:predicted RNA-binding Zn ribbon-like protein
MEEFRLWYGAAWLNLLASQRARRRPPAIEDLTDPSALRRWLVAAELAPDRDPDERDLTAAIRLREALYAIARATVDGGEPDPDDAEVLNDALAQDRAPAVGVRGGSVVVGSPPDTATALAWIARQAVTDLTGPTRERLRACGDESCAGIFVDDSGRRRWCADRTCGSRARVRAHRARAKAGPDGSTSSAV